MKKTPHHSAEFWDISVYNRIYNRIKRSIRETKRNYYNNKFDKCKSKKTWQIINNVINKQKSKSIPAYMTVDDKRSILYCKPI